MANMLDETRDPVASGKGRDVRVIEKQVPATVGKGTVVFFKYIGWFLLVIPGIVFLVQRLKAKNYFSALEQKIQAAASTVDNYLEQRVTILKNAAKLLDKSIELDRDVMTKVAAYRGGVNPNADAARNTANAQIDKLFGQINVALERYPDLKAHADLENCMQQNAYLQKEITAARELYNDAVLEWNKAIFEWPHKVMVAAKEGYTTRIPFSTSDDVREEARGTFF